MLWKKERRRREGEQGEEEEECSQVILLSFLKVEYFNYFDERKLKIAYYSYLLNP